MIWRRPSGAAGPWMVQTADRDGGWSMPVTAQPGDLAIWYAASPDQEYVAYGWTAGLPSKREPTRQPYGPVAGVRPLPGGPIPRAEVAAKAHGFQETNVGQLAVPVPVEIEGARLRALGFGKRFAEVRGPSPEYTPG